MYFYFILLFCIIQNASPIPIDEEIQLTHYNPRDIKVSKKTPRNLYEEDSTDLSSDSRRFSNWVKNKHDKEIQLRNFNPDDVELNEKLTRDLFEEDSPDLNSQARKVSSWVKLLKEKDSRRKISSRKQVLKEIIRFRRIEKQIAEILTKLSHVLTDVNVLKRNHRAHSEIHKVPPTTTTTRDYTTSLYYLKYDSHLNNAGRWKRDLNKSNIVPKKINASNGHNKGVNDSIEILPRDAFMNHEYQTKIDPNRSKKDENKKIYMTEVLTEFSEHNQNNQNGFIKQPVNHTKGDATANVESQELNKQNNPTTTDAESVNIQEKRNKRNAADLKQAVTERPKKMEVEKVEVKQHGSEKTEVTDTSTDAAEIAKTGRRALSTIQATHVEVKNRLFKYIDEAFAEIEKKTDYLKQMKQMFSADVSYNIGYIISNIDTLEVNMRNMKRDMDINKFIWDDKKILNLYDTVKVSNQAIADLLEILRNYVEKSSI